MSGTDSCCGEIVSNHGIELLVRFLCESEPQFGSEAELAACERLHQKSAIALTRLCKDEHSCQSVLDFQGESFLSYWTGQNQKAFRVFFWTRHWVFLALLRAGVPRLIQLCQDPTQRHNSDAVLVACLVSKKCLFLSLPFLPAAKKKLLELVFGMFFLQAALRKISSICSLEEVDESATETLIAPKLMDSFIACSNLQGSIVSHL